MFVISGQVKQSTTVGATSVPLRQLGDQEFQIVEAAKSMTKYAYMVTEPKEILYNMQKALFLCRNGRPGPVWLDIPLDVQGAVVETDTLRKYDPKEDNDEIPSEVDQNTIEAVLGKIRSAERPVVFAGSGIRLSNGYEGFLS